MSDTTTFMDALYGHKPPDSYIVLSTKNGNGWGPSTAVATTVEAAGIAEGAIDIYSRISVIGRRLKHRERGKAADSVAIAAIWMEIDVNGCPDGRGGIITGAFDSIDAGIAIANQILPLSLGVQSGYGAHGYVLLDRPWVLETDEDRAHAKALVQRYQAAVRARAKAELGVTKLDSTHDLARVFRPPGSFNRKGETPVPVQLMFINETRTAVAEIETAIPIIRTKKSSGAKTSGKRRKVTVDQEAVDAALAEHPGLETLSARTGGDPSSNDYALACAAAREGLEPDLIEMLLAHRLIRHGDPKGKAQRDDYIPTTVERAIAAVERERRDEEHGDPLAEASAIIGMQKIPIIAAEERHSGVVVLERKDALVLKAPSLTALAKYERLSAELAACFGHELTVEKGQGARTAVRFVAALRRHFGPGHIRTLEETVEMWLIELVRAASEKEFTPGEAKASAWNDINDAEPDDAKTTPGFAEKVVLAHDTTTHDRYLRAGWAHEYLRRCGWRNADATVDMLVAIGLEQPNADGRVKGGTLQFRFWIIPAALFERWSS